MRKIGVALLALAAVVVAGCSGGSAGKQPGQQGTPAPAPAPGKQADPAPSSLGGTYKGKVARGYDITFEVSPDGKQVTKVAANALESCTGSSTTRTTQLFWEGPFAIGPNGSVSAEGPDPEYKELKFKFTANFGADGSASGTVLQMGAGCTTYELTWMATKQ